jgi:hypothetical protein
LWTEIIRLHRGIGETYGQCHQEKKEEDQSAQTQKTACQDPAQAQEIE